MAYKIKMNPTSKIKKRLGINPSGRVQKFFTNTCYKAMDKYVPRREGNLRENVTIDATTITYEMPYAHAQYVGRTKGPVKNYTTPGTGPKWDRRMWSVEKEKVIKATQNYLEGGLSNGLW